MAKKRSKYQKEILKIEELQVLDRIMKKEEIEGMLLSNPSRESETVNDSIVDRILNKFKLNRNDVKKLDMIERQTMGGLPRNAKATPLRGARTAAGNGGRRVGAAGPKTGKARKAAGRPAPPSPRGSSKPKGRSPKGWLHPIHKARALLSKRRKGKNKR